MVEVIITKSLLERFKSQMFLNSTAPINLSDVSISFARSKAFSALLWFALFHILEVHRSVEKVEQKDSAKLSRI